MISRIWSRVTTERLHPLRCVYGVALAGGVTLVGEGAWPFMQATHLALMYLLAVLVAATRLGLWPALLTAVLSVAALDYLFVQPYYSFEVSAPQDVVLLALLLVGAVIASGLAARLREQVTIARENAETTAALYRFAGKLAGTMSLDATIRTATDQVVAMLPHHAEIFLGTEPPASAPLTLALRSSGETFGYLTVTPQDGRGTTEEQRRLLEGLTELAGIAIGRQILADRLSQLDIEKAADRLRSALLNSIAHDLTAPIASVATVLTSLVQNYGAFDDTTRRELITEAEREAEHLHQFSAKLIHIARLESGAVDLQRRPTALDELVDAALVRAHGVLGSRRVAIDIPALLPLLHVDPVLIEQALFHILENAAKYTPPDALVTIDASPAPAGVTLRIADEGPGVPPGDNERIFDKFYRANPLANVPGTGLGLAICRGFIEAHAGTITAANRADRTGAIFTITLPA